MEHQADKSGQPVQTGRVKVEIFPFNLLLGGDHKTILIMYLHRSCHHTTGTSLFFRLRCKEIQGGVFKIQHDSVLQIYSPRRLSVVPQNHSEQGIKGKVRQSHTIHPPHLLLPPVWVRRLYYKTRGSPSP